jgi:hypothetical protein
VGEVDFPGAIGINLEGAATQHFYFVIWRNVGWQLMKAN